MPLITKQQARRSGIPSNTLQTILMPSKYSLVQAKAWLAEHHYANGYYRTIRNYRRFMQTPPIRGAEYFSKVLPNGVELVFQTY